MQMNSWDRDSIREKILSYLYKAYQTWYGHVRCEGKNSEIAVNLVVIFASVSRVLIKRKILNHTYSVP